MAIKKGLREREREREGEREALLTRLDVVCLLAVKTTHV